MFEPSLRMRWIHILRALRLSLGRAAVAHSSFGLPQLVDISVFDFFDSTSPVKLFANLFICMDKLVYLSGKLVILSADYVDMIVHRIYFVLHG